MTDDPTAPIDPRGEPVEIDTTVAHASRVYDYMLGGTTHFAADRAASHAASQIFPGGEAAASAGLKANRAFLGRAVRYLAAEAGIRQFLDIGTGIPTGDNVHEAAQRVAPESRIVYVDYDPIVLAHAHELLRSTSEGATTYIQEDLRNPDAVLEHAAATLDFSQPMAVILVAVLHFLRDEEDPYGLVTRLIDAVPSGSYVVVSHLARDILELDEVYERLSAATHETFVLRTHPEVSRFVDGLEVLDPGIVLVNEWRPESGAVPYDRVMLPLYGAVGRKP